MHKKRQKITYLLLAVGAGLVIYDLFSKNDNLYLKIIGLMLLMFGVYSISQSRSIGKMEQSQKEHEANIKDEQNGENS